MYARVEEGKLVEAEIFVFCMLRLLRELKDAELGDELVKYHDFVLLDTTELGSHYTVKHLVEEDEAIVDLDSHLEDDALYILILTILFNFHLL